MSDKCGGAAEKAFPMSQPATLSNKRRSKKRDNSYRKKRRKQEVDEHLHESNSDDRDTLAHREQSWKQAKRNFSTKRENLSIERSICDSLRHDTSYGGAVAQPQQTASIHRQRLVWNSKPYVPVETEDKMLDVLLLKRGERGMICRHRKQRYQTILAHCNVSGMQLAQALSLRRHHIKLRHPKLGMQQLQLGAEKEIRRSAELFEGCVDSFLRRSGLDFLTEVQQKREYAQAKGPSPPTPDFMLKLPVSLHVSVRDIDCSVKRPGSGTPKEHVIHWIEAKMFYGASTIPDNGVGAVGCIRRTAKKYTDLYGQGAMVFMYGCGVRLADELLQYGVVALDSYPIDLQTVESHQRTWCANKDGVILS